MHRLLIFAGLLALAPLTQAAEAAKPSNDALKEKLQTVIRGQLEAFRKGDFVAAYAFAAPALREQFPLAAFEQMVKIGYPEIAANADVAFGLTLDDGEQAVANVRVVKANGESANYQYFLERTGEEWRIAGVFALKDRDSAI